jgi:hypothetical protein
LVPVVKLYDRGQTMLPSRLLHPRLAKPALFLHPETAAWLGLGEGVPVQFDAGAKVILTVPLSLDEALPLGVAALPRSAGLPVFSPRGVKLQKAPETVYDSHPR